MGKHVRLTAIVVICLSFAGQINAQAKSFDILTPQVKQGGTVVLKIDTNFLNGKTAVWAFNKFYWPDNEGLVFAGVDPSYIPGNYIVYLQDPDKEERTDWYYGEVTVNDANFPERPWPFGRVKKVAPPTESKKRKQERIVINDALEYSYRDPEEQYIDRKFTPPLERTEVIEEFGVKRVSRGLLVEQHGGVDLRTNDPADRKDKKPKPVSAVNSGKVALAGKFSSEGNLVIIYHGQGIYSLYMHMSQLKVKTNQKVDGGQVIGLSGRTGHVTGPHLDFRVKINGSYVDPLAFIETANKYLE